MTAPSTPKNIPGVKNIILVGSGKGGVGKSTVCVQLAAALQKCGQKVGVLDADIYGPSVPRLLGCLSQQPDVTPQNKIVPLERAGLKVMSMGLMVGEEQAVIWRGPMLFKAMDQFLFDVQWGELDYLLVDLPPGTGDIALTMSQKVSVSGAITVCTPQNLALSDAKKALDMYEKLGIKRYGVVENMSYLERDGEKIELFPTGDLVNYLKSIEVKHLGALPFDPALAKSEEAGLTVFESDPNGEVARAFMGLADFLMSQNC